MIKKYIVVFILLNFVFTETVTQEGTDAGNFLKLETGISGIGMGVLV